MMKDKELLVEETSKKGFLEKHGKNILLGFFAICFSMFCLYQMGYAVGKFIFYITH